MRELGCYIAGHWVTPVMETVKLAVTNPATEQTVAKVSMAGIDDAEAAVQAAALALDSWSQTTIEQRMSLVEHFLQQYESHYEDMAQAISTEMGSPIDSAREIQAETGVGHTRAFLESMANMVLEQRHEDNVQVVREPIGVCVLITPWNWPVNQIVCKVVPALLAGCTVVLKPSELTPLSAQLYAEFMAAAKFPAGVFNMVHGTGSVIGSYLASHPLVNMVSFTGSTRAGVAVAKAAADTVKRVTQELGGKSPNIIFADADLSAAIRHGVSECMFNTGQSCDAPTRMLVEQSVYAQAEILARLAVKAIKTGAPSQSGDHLGPLVSQQQWDKVQRLIQIGIDEGAVLLAGGTGKPDGLNIGYYAKPTLFGNVNNQMKIAQEEIFGPVLVLIPFATEEEAIAIANDTPYGLGAYLYTGDLQRGHRVARQLKAGTVHINGAALAYTTPFGGYKQSGNGREYGAYGIHDFQEIKAISGYYTD